MGGTTFTVSCEELSALAAELLGTADQLRTLSAVRGDYAGIVGSDEVAGALHEFFDHWSDGMDRIGRHVQEIGERLRRAAEAYEEVECAVVRGAGGGGVA